MASTIWRHFLEGEKIADSKVIVGKTVFRHRRKDRTEYAVEYLCCGARDVLTHSQILERGRRKAQRCAYCCGNPGSSAKKVSRTALAASWPVPPSVLADGRPFVWGGDRGGR